MGDRSRGRRATPAEFPLHDGTPYQGLRKRRWGLGFVHHSWAILCRPVPNLSVTIPGQRACQHAQLGIPETAHGPTLEYHELPHGSATHSHYDSQTFAYCTHLLAGGARHHDERAQRAQRRERLAAEAEGRELLQVAEAGDLGRVVLGAQPLQTCVCGEGGEWGALVDPRLQQAG